MPPQDVDGDAVAKTSKNLKPIREKTSLTLTELNVKVAHEKFMRLMEFWVLLLLALFCIALVLIMDSLEDVIKLVTIVLPAFTFLLGRGTRDHK